MEYPEKDNIILTDSMSALVSLNSFKNNIKVNPYILEIKSQARQFSQLSVNGCKLKFVWVPSHIGLEGNEHADLLKNASTSAANTSLKIPFTDFF